MNIEKEGEFFPRKIKFIVIHCSALCCNDPFLPEKPGECLTFAEAGVMGYHFYIARDGRVYKTGDIRKPGVHTNGFNLHSIGICYEGGVDEYGNPADTRSVWQKKSMDDLVCALRTCYPAAVIRGHYQLTADRHRVCPCFNPGREYGKER